MKRSDYKPLGDYIALVNERNRDLAITHLVGVSIEKKFIPSIANIIGTDLSPYKIIRHNQFAYGPVTSRNGEKITIALYKDTEDGILSQAYEVFRIKEEEVLMPEYLMLWVQRPEFDRYARFKSHGSVRELFSWEEMCNVMLPVPPIAEQRKIVEQYQTIERRIKNNEALIQKLEATAQALYHHTFVEGIDKENLPEGWRMGKLRELGKDIICGKTPSTEIPENFGNYIPFITIPDMHNKVFIFHTERMLSETGEQTQKNKTIPEDSVCVSCIGTPGLVTITTQSSQTNQQINSIIPREEWMLYYIYMVSLSLEKIITEYGTGGAVLSNLSKSQFENLLVLIPDNTTLLRFHKQVVGLFSNIKKYQKEALLLDELRKIIMSKVY